MRDATRGEILPAAFRQSRRADDACSRAFHSAHRRRRDLFLLASESLISASVLLQAATALSDRELIALLERVVEHNQRERRWLFMRARQAAPQVLVVPS